MTNEQQQVKEWMAAFGQETPDKPCVPSLEVRKLRAKLILEEALETITALGIRVHCLFDDGSHARMEDFIDQFNFSEFGNEPSLDAIADGCEDLKVVTEGTLVACGLVSNNHIRTDKLDQVHFTDPLFDEIMRSNWSKMWTEDSLDIYLTDDECKKHQMIKHGDKYLVKDSSGKVIKSPSYSPANLQPIIDELR